jgi:hypothetical protein
MPQVPAQGAKIQMDLATEVGVVDVRKEAERLTAYFF